MGAGAWMGQGANEADLGPPVHGPGMASPSHLLLSALCMALLPPSASAEPGTDESVLVECDHVSVQYTLCTVHNVPVPVVVTQCSGNPCLDADVRCERWEVHVTPHWNAVYASQRPCPFLP